MPHSQNTAIISCLKAQLHADVTTLHIHSDSRIAGYARRRLEAVAEYFPVFMEWLVEPWLNRPATEAVETTILCAARIHLYARILDDCLDENLPVYRTNLLRVQPLFWQSVQGLAVLYPAHCDDMTALISETVLAVQADDQQAKPEYWGRKNHHLLLAPLLLSGNNAAFQSCRSGLSTLITLTQAGDEWRQGKLINPAERQAFFNWLTETMIADHIKPLITHGYSGAAERIVWEARQLMTVLNNG
ncbi:MAG: hypothetical protein ACR2HF_14590 [Methylococcaceae bacterium]